MMASPSLPTKPTRRNSSPGVRRNRRSMLAVGPARKREGRSQDRRDLGYESDNSARQDPEVERLVTRFESVVNGVMSSMMHRLDEKYEQMAAATQHIEDGQ